MDVTLPNGNTISNVPESATKEQVKAEAIRLGLATEADFQGQQSVAPIDDVVDSPSSEQVQSPVPNKSPSSVGDYLSEMIGGAIGGAETMGSIATGLGAEAVSGWAGILSGGDPEAVERVQEMLTYSPRTEKGKEYSQNLGNMISDVGDVITGDAAAPLEDDDSFTKNVREFVYDSLSSLPDKTLEATGSPAAATAVHMLPDLLTLGGISKAAIKNIPEGERLKNPDGTLTDVAARALDKEGLSDVNISPEALEAIPEFADRKFLTGTAKVGDVANDVIKKELELGTRSDNLADYKLSNGRVVNDTVAEAAQSQGWEKGLIQMVKTSKGETKKTMRKMLDSVERANNDFTSKNKNRPLNFVGQELDKRLKFLDGEVKKASVKLNDISRRRFKGKPVNPKPAIEGFAAALEDLDIKPRQANGEFVRDKNGIPKLDFDDSIISKDASAQRVINNAMDLLGKGDQTIDAYKVHKLKRQLDSMIDYQKSSGKGLTDKGKNTLKTLRSGLNDVLRKADPEYAEVNDVLSGSLGALDKFQDAMGKRVSLSEENAISRIGQEARTLATNYNKRTIFEDAIKDLDSASNKIGGNFDNNIEDLVNFAYEVEDGIGKPIAKGSMQGIQQGAAEKIARDGVSGTLKDKLAEKVGELENQIKGINEKEKILAMRQLLREE